MSLLIKALNKAEEAQSQNAKAERAQAQYSIADAQTQYAKDEASAERVKFERTSAKNKPSIAIENAGDMVLSLAPATRIIDESSLVDALLADAGVVKSGATLSASPKSAASVFIAKGNSPSSGNKSLAVIAGLALFALLGMGAYFVQFVDNAPAMALPARTTAVLPSVSQLPFSQSSVAQSPPPVVDTETILAAAPTRAGLASITEKFIPLPTNASAKLPEPTSAFAPRKFNQKQLAETQQIEARITSQKRSTKKYALKPTLAPEFADGETMVETVVETMVESKVESKVKSKVNANNTIDPENDLEAVEAGAPINASKTSSHKTGKAKTGKLGKIIASESASINVSKSQAQSGVNPTLMSAFEAYAAGKDSQAQKLYKQVLQRDVRSVDALLGMGAIAQRQGRADDANGWYGKVLEVEPRNNIARAAMLDNQPQGNALNNESHIKNMLAQQPNDANLHAALGNLYAEQNQWPAAQQAYFDAYRLHASADNALNLAVSLDQMGKSKLALPYYQRALTLAQTGSNGIDKAALEARIAAIQ